MTRGGTAPAIGLLGSGGMLGQAIRQEAAARNLPLNLAPPGCDIRKEENLKQWLEQIPGPRKGGPPTVVINCAAYTAVDQAEAPVEEKRALEINGDGPGLLARLCHQLGFRLIHVSTDYVFSGDKTKPYRPSDEPDPQSAYGRSKLAGERAIAGSGLAPEYSLIVRTAWLYGLYGKCFPLTMLRLFSSGRSEISVVDDQYGAPTNAADLAGFLLGPALEKHTSAQMPDFLSGIWHFSNTGRINWFEFAGELRKMTEVWLRENGFDHELEPEGSWTIRRIHPISTREFGAPAPRPANSSLDLEPLKKFFPAFCRDWENSLRDFLDQYLRAVLPPGGKFPGKLGTPLVFQHPDMATGAAVPPGQNPPENEKQ